MLEFGGEIKCLSFLQSNLVDDRSASPRLTMNLPRRRPEERFMVVIFYHPVLCTFEIFQKKLF